MYIPSNIREISGIIALGLTFFAFFPYLKSIISGQTKPHVFSWIIWALTTIIVFFAQLADGGGFGAWIMGFSGAITLLIAVLAYIKKSDDAITKIDWVFFAIALLSLPFWYLTSNPLWAVIILTFVDLFGFLPTIRKAFVKPFEEQILLYVLISVRNVFAVIALDHYSATTILFPVSITIQCIVLIVILVLQRKAISNRLTDKN